MSLSRNGSGCIVWRRLKAKSWRTKAVARELAPRGVTVNAVSPGFVDTEMTRALGEETRAAYRSIIPAGREASVEDVAEAVAYLAGPAASYVTGQVLRVNGGLYM